MNKMTIIKIISLMICVEMCAIIPEHDMQRVRQCIEDYRIAKQNMYELDLQTMQLYAQKDALIASKQQIISVHSKREPTLTECIALENINRQCQNLQSEFDKKKADCATQQQTALNTIQIILDQDKQINSAVVMSLMQEFGEHSKKMYAEEKKFATLQRTYDEDISVMIELNNKGASEWQKQCEIIEGMRTTMQQNLANYQKQCYDMHTHLFNEKYKLERLEAECNQNRQQLEQEKEDCLSTLRQILTARCQSSAKIPLCDEAAQQVRDYVKQVNEKIKTSNAQKEQIEQDKKAHAEKGKKLAIARRQILEHVQQYRDDQKQWCDFCKYLEEQMKIYQDEKVAKAKSMEEQIEQIKIQMSKSRAEKDMMMNKIMTQIRRC